jgi:DNA helicase-2/ATP-dependent DNA helicase PcrA
VREGHKIKLVCLYDDRQEARFVAAEIEDLAKQDIIYSNMAVLIRAGHQSRVFEEAFNRVHLPYKIVGGLKFYERAEVRDIIAYIRLLVNATDMLAFERIVNVPRRAIGKSTLDKIVSTSKMHNISYYKASEQLIISGIIKGKAKSALLEFLDVMERHRIMLIHPEYSHNYVVENLVTTIDYSSVWKDEEDHKERMDNVRELLRSLHDFPSLSSYLEHVSLITDTDNIETEDCVHIMTIHASKGLEFDSVFLVGWEDGLFPSQRAIDSRNHSALEEERRLAYVAITRARNNLYISCAERRRMYGGISMSIPSRFLAELPKDSVERVFPSYIPI